MATRNAEVVGSIYAALARGDLDAAVAALDPDVEWVEPNTPGLPFAGVHRGRQGVVSGVFATVPKTWDDFNVEAEELLGAGEAVVAIGRFRGRVGDRQLDAPFAHVWRVRGGFAAEFRNFTDTAAFLSALGSPAASPAS
jgi:ketosteroid isomerase-like protein